MSGSETNVDETGPDRLLDIAAAAEVLNVPYGWLQVRVTKRLVPHTRLGKHVRFTREHLAQIIADGEQSAQTAHVAPPRQTARRTKL